MFSLLSRPATQGAALSRDPFSLVDAMFNELATQRGGSSLVSRARIEVTERNGAYEVRAELPGAKKEDIAIDIDGACVSISAKVSSQSERKEGERVLYSERSHESYARAFELPQAVDAQAAEAKFDNGMLTLTLPKKDAPRSTRLAVR
jgi:HSP20 family protein